jgi:transcriptional regulator of acetoin/glycerol metabolism
MYSAFQSNAFQDNAFQVIKNVVEAIVGGIGSNRRKKVTVKARQRRFFIEDKGEILIFANAEQAQAWTLAQQQLSKSVKKRKKISLPIAEPLEKLDISQIKDVAEKYGKTTSVNKLLESGSYAKIVTLYETIIQQDFYIQSLRRKIEEQDEEDIAMLLMAL